MRRGGTLGARWDTRFLRRVREYGWFRVHEAEMIGAARRRRAETGAARTKDDPKPEPPSTRAASTP
jgi:hypothetical protein